MNPALRAMGYDPSDRVAVVHADDVGMCQATIPAFAELVDIGLVTSGSVMVPSPWFPSIADWCRKNPEADVGVHLTLTSEWDPYRWGPVSSPARGSGLTDPEGYFHRHRDLPDGLDLEAAHREMDAQIDRACIAGIDVTHIDTHMYVATRGSLLGRYARTALARGVPALIVRDWHTFGAEERREVAGWEEQGLPVFDHLFVSNCQGRTPDAIERAKKAWDSLPAGLSCVLLHPACNTPEIRAVATDWRFRVEDYEVYRSRALLDHVRDQGFHLIGYRDLSRAMKRQSVL